MRVCAARRAAASPASALPPPRPPRRERSGPGRGRPGAGSGTQRAGRRREGGEEKQRAAPPGEPSPSRLPPAARPRCPPLCHPHPGAPGRSPLSPRRQRALPDVRPSAGCALRGKRPLILPCFPGQKRRGIYQARSSFPFLTRSAPSRDAGALHALPHRRSARGGWAGGRRDVGISAGTGCPARRPRAPQQLPAPSHPGPPAFQLTPGVPAVWGGVKLI